MLNRLLAIIYILMNKGTVTARELAERFEVSVRTIYRDVESLSMAGIPIYTRKGKNGGISLTEQFVLNKMLVSREEQIQILAGLASLEEVGAEEEQETLQKLAEFFHVDSANWVSIDFSDWSGRRQELFGQIKQAVLNHKVMEFDYYGQYGNMSRRCVEPVQLLFKEYTWYLRAWCRGRQAMRLFKVLRMKRVVVTEEEFKPDVEKHLLKDEDAKGQELPEQTEPCRKLVLEIDASEAYRIYDRFEEDEITRQQDGSFLVQTEFMLDDWVYGMILSFGPSARVLEPPEAAAEIKSRVEKMRAAYEAVQP